MNMLAKTFLSFFFINHVATCYCVWRHFDILYCTNSHSTPFRIKNEPLRFPYIFSKGVIPIYTILIEIFFGYPLISS